MPDANAFVAHEDDVPWEPSRRPGVRHRRLLGPEVSDAQHVVLVEADAGAEVELHPVATCESLYVLSGAYTLVLPEGARALGPGALVYFERGSEHGLVCDEPGRFLAIFAPPSD